MGVEGEIRRMKGLIRDKRREFGKLEKRGEEGMLEGKEERRGS